MSTEYLSRLDYELLLQYRQPTPRPTEKKDCGSFDFLYKQKYILSYSHELVSFDHNTRGITTKEWLITPAGERALALYEEKIASEQKQQNDIASQKKRDLIIQIIKDLGTSAIPKVTAFFVDNWLQIKQFFHNLF